MRHRTVAMAAVAVCLAAGGLAALLLPSWRSYQVRDADRRTVQVQQGLWRVCATRKHGGRGIQECHALSRDFTVAGVPETINQGEFAKLQVVAAFAALSVAAAGVAAATTTYMAVAVCRVRDRQFPGGVYHLWTVCMVLSFLCGVVCGSVFVSVMAAHPRQYGAAFVAAVVLWVLDLLAALIFHCSRPTPHSPPSRRRRLRSPLRPKSRRSRSRHGDTRPLVPVLTEEDDRAGDTGSRRSAHVNDHDDGFETPVVDVGDID